jgi:hypothetical protein
MEKVEIWTWPTGSRDNHSTLDSHNNSNLGVLLPASPLVPSELSFIAQFYPKSKTQKKQEMKVMKKIYGLYERENVRSWLLKAFKITAIWSATSTVVKVTMNRLITHWPSRRCTNISDA